MIQVLPMNNCEKLLGPAGECAPLRAESSFCLLLFRCWNRAPNSLALQRMAQLPDYVMPMDLITDLKQLREVRACAVLS
jgi:hypothetical protein